MEIKLNLKRIGKKSHSVKETIYQISKRPDTVRELILEVVKTGVEDYNQRKEAPEVLTWMTKEVIEDKAQAGKVAFGVNYGENLADLKAAQDNAVLSFEDGIYRIFLNDRPLEDLEEKLTITEEDVFTFVRLTMLAGRMW